MKLFEPWTIKEMKLKNRLVMAPMATHIADEECKVTPSMMEYYERIAQGGVGMIFVEGTVIDHAGLNFKGLGLYNEEQIEGLAKLADKIKKHDCRAILQIHHAGRLSLMKFNGGRTPVGPSAIPVSHREPCRELSTEEVEELIEKHVSSAKWARMAGFDGIEVHAAHALLIAQFLSSRLNKRTDRFGGKTIEKRCTFLLNIVNRIREELGDDYFVSLRISASEFHPDGINEAETIEICKIVKNSGIDLIDVSGGSLELTPYWLVQPMMIARGCLTEFADQIRKNVQLPVQLPVMVVGRINKPELAERILRDGKADLIGIGRALLADPDFPVKAKESHFEDIRPCIGCNSCIDRPPIEGLKCAVNPLLMKHEKLLPKKSKQKKEVLVIGGGPAGIQASLTLLERGHKVKLVEKSGHLGGKLNIASKVPGKKEINELVKYLTGQLSKRNVEILLRTKATGNVVNDMNPDAVIIAEGANPKVPEIPGIQKAGFFLAEEVLNDEVEVGERVAIIGGGMVGCDTALYLTANKKCKSVVVLRRGKRFGVEIGGSMRRLYLDELKKAQIKLISEVTYEGMTNDGLIITKNGEENLVEADNFIIAIGYQSNSVLYNEINKKLQKSAYIIGDAKEPRLIFEAIHDGFETALLI